MKNYLGNIKNYPQLNIYYNNWSNVPLKKIDYLIKSSTNPVTTEIIELLDQVIKLREDVLDFYYQRDEEDDGHIHIILRLRSWRNLLYSRLI